MQALKNGLLQVANESRFCILFRSEFHISVSLQKKIKRSPNYAHELPEPRKTSWGRMVTRGMIPKEQPEHYTAKPLAVKKTGGRDVDGRIQFRRIGGGLKVVWHMADLVRITETESDPKVEVVKDIIEEQTRSAYLALVVGGEQKRWVIATENMKVGDIIQSTREIPPIASSGQPGDSYPVGALSIGTQVCCVERYPHQGAAVANSAGNAAIIVNKIGDMVTLKMPSKREMVVNERCLCVVGRVSNVDRNKRILGKAGASRLLGIRPKSGLWMKKTGIHGRKMKPLPKPAVYETEKKYQNEAIQFTVDRNLFKRRRGLTDFLPL